MCYYTFDSRNKRTLHSHTHAQKVTYETNALLLITYEDKLFSFLTGNHPHFLNFCISKKIFQVQDSFTIVLCFFKKVLGDICTQHIPIYSSYMCILNQIVRGLSIQ